jgi:hypothetical protein
MVGTVRCANRWVIGVAAAVVWGLAGCLERTEEIRVSPDGAVTLRSTLRGDPADITGPGDAMPVAGRTWAVTDAPQEDGNRLVRVAEAVVPPGGAIPESYAEPDDPRGHAALRFPTTLTIEERPDGTYYHLRRTYVARQDATYTYMKRLLEEEDRLPLDTDPRDLTDAQRAELVDALKRIEVDKHLHFVDAGLAALPDLPQDRALAVRSAVVRAAETYDAGPILALLVQEESAERNAAIAAGAEAFVAGLRAAVDAALTAQGIAGADRAAFEAAYRAEEDRRAVTEDLADERWVVRVNLPGEVVAHNADRVEDGTLVWEFTALAVMDRDQVIMASSRVPRRGQ